MRPFESPAIVISDCEPVGFLADSAVIDRGMLPPPLDFGVCEEEATDLRELAACLWTWTPPIADVAVNDPAPPEPIDPLASAPRISSPGSKARIDWRPATTIFAGGIRALTGEPEAYPAPQETLTPHPPNMPTLIGQVHRDLAALTIFVDRTRSVTEEPVSYPAPQETLTPHPPRMPTLIGQVYRDLAALTISVGRTREVTEEAAAYPAPQETLTPHPAQISPLIGQLHYDRLPALTIPLWTTRRLTVEPWKVAGVTTEPAALDAIVPKIATGRTGRIRATCVSDGFPLAGMGPFGWNLASCPPAIYESSTLAADAEACIGALSIERIAPMVQTARLSTGVAASHLLSIPVNAGSAHRLASAVWSNDWTGALAMASVIQPLKSPRFALRPVAAASYRTVGADPARGEVTSSFLFSDWIEEGGQTAIPRLAPPSHERRRTAGCLRVRTTDATPSRSSPDSSIPVSGHTVAAANPSIGNAIRGVNPLRIAARDSLGLEWIPLVDVRTWPRGNGLAFSYTEKFAIRRPRYAAAASPGHAEPFSSRRPAVNDAEAALRFKPRRVMRAAARPRLDRLAHTLLAALRPADQVVHSSLLARRSEFVIPFIPEAGLWELASRIPAASGHSVAHLRRITPLERFHPQNRFTSVVPAHLSARLAHRTGIAFPHTSVDDPAALVRGGPKELLLQSAGTEPRQPVRAVALAPSPALLIARPVSNDPIPAAPGVCARIQTPGMRPVRGKLHLGVTARLERETELPRVNGAIRLDRAIPAIHAMTGTVNLLLEHQNARIESRIESIVAIRVQPASIFTAPASPALKMFGMPRPWTIAPGVFPASRRDIPISGQTPEPRAMSTHLCLQALWRAPWSGTTASALDTKLLWLWAATSSVEHFPGWSSWSSTPASGGSVASSFGAGALPPPATAFQYTSNHPKDGHPPAAAPGTLQAIEWIFRPRKPSMLRELSQLRPVRSGQNSNAGLIREGAMDAAAFGGHRRNGHKENHGTAD